MKSVLEELWYGNVCPDTECRKVTKEIKRLMGCIAEHYDKLKGTLTDEQKGILERFEDRYTELTDVNERKIFVYAFRLGARMAMEMMSFGPD